jgi:nitrogen regulatory protein PII
MRFKLILAIANSTDTRRLLKAAREAGATGATVIKNASGEGLDKSYGILGLEIFDARDVLLFVVEEHRARHVLETLAKVGEFDETPGTGIALQLDVEDALGVEHQVRTLMDSIKDTL